MSAIVKQSAALPSFANEHHSTQTASSHGRVDSTISGRVEKSANKQHKLALEGSACDMVVCDLRNPRQASAFENWHDQQPELSQMVKTTVLRCWILWPRLRSKKWEHDTASIIVSQDESSMIKLAYELDGQAGDDSGSHDLCKCSMKELLQASKLDIDALQSMNGQRFTVLEVAEFVAHMMREDHLKRLKNHVAARGTVETCGRQWNACVKCKCSRAFFCDYGLVLADADSVQSGKKQEVVERYPTRGWSDPESRSMLDAYDPYRYDRPYRG